MALYPLKFSPLFKYRIWGGVKLKTHLNKDYLEENIGESWEVSDVKGDETTVLNGALSGKTLRALIAEYKGDFVGESVYEKFGNEFPLLIKFIDAKTPLSIQVHPSNEIAKVRHNAFGKNEMWYVMQADDEAELIIGFENDITKEDYQEHLINSSVLEVMHREKVRSGDTFYIPTGRVHAIGAGVLLAEIQQTSDVTYRIYDYDRVDAKTGKKRDLHNDLAIDVLDFQAQESYKADYELEVNKFNTLVHSPYFKTNIVQLKGHVEKDYSKLDSFVIFMCVEGNAEVVYLEETYTLDYGETILLPACLDAVVIKSNSAKLLEVYY
ncbi:type I phosphomannose isomerase catalytic subunit [Seonamhaeicola sp. ML3]|uniref:type I phosphomannose isomerase catalytic subunit n=1 Tax=Seonamhaeicola sp. ML3 TaxID=2937786 RepID=UPI00200BB7DF|nr:type I phosphomannose isomerase catalytic subunit [Seonamhaeicola sp. ML3]